MSLNTLPTEIVLQILGYFTTRNAKDRETFAALCLSSHRLYVLTMPLLYHTPFRRLERDDTYPTADSTRLPLLLRSLLRKPALGKLVVEMNTVYTGQEFQFANVMDALADADWKLAEEAFQTICAPDQPNDCATPMGRANSEDNADRGDFWYEELTQGRHDSVFHLVLLFLRRVKRLRVYDWQNSYRLEDRCGTCLYGRKFQRFLKWKLKQTSHLGTVSASHFAKTKSALEIRYREQPQVSRQYRDGTTSVYYKIRFSQSPSVSSR